MAKTAKQKSFDKFWFRVVKKQNAVAVFMSIRDLEEFARQAHGAGWFDSFGNCMRTLSKMTRSKQKEAI